jgi:chromosome segregation ATPase
VSEFERLLARHGELHDRVQALSVVPSQVRDLEAALQECRQRLADQQAELEELRQQIGAFRAQVAGLQQRDAAAVVERIKTDPALRELLRGPRGLAGTDGKPGPAGDNGATVIREVKIHG